MTLLSSSPSNHRSNKRKIRCSSAMKWKDPWSSFEFNHWFFSFHSSRHEVKNKLNGSLYPTRFHHDHFSSIRWNNPYPSLSCTTTSLTSACFSSTEPERRTYIPGSEYDILLQKRKREIGLSVSKHVEHYRRETITMTVQSHPWVYFHSKTTAEIRRSVQVCGRFHLN